ncbi:MAG: NADH-quinone oxidoreductase subunit 5 family protein [Thermoleophilia bacterium]
MIWLPIFLPVVAGLAAGFAVPGRSLGAAAALAMAATAALGLWAASVRASAELSWGGLLQLRFELTGAAGILIVLVPVVAAPVIAFATWEYADDPDLRRLVGLLLSFVGSMELLVAAGDLLSLVIGWELVAAFSWALIAYHWRAPKPPQAALEAYVTVRFGGVGLFIAAGAVFASTGSLDYAALATTARPWLDLAAAGLLLAAASKSAQVPFSQWLFSAMEGPAPVSALLHSATMVAAGTYALIRLAPFFAPLGWFGPAVIAIGLMSALAGGAVASVQTDFKRVLAGSTTAQYGLMFVAIGAASTTAASAHLITHAFFKSLLFLGAGVALATAGTGSLAHLRLGSGKRVVAVFFGVGVLALAAVPPLGGAFSKEAIVAAAVDYSPWVGAGVFLAGFMSAFYAARLFTLAFGSVKGDPAGSAVGAGGEVWSMGLLAGVSVLMGLLRVPAIWRELEKRSVPREAAEPLWQLAVSLLVIALAFAAVRVLHRRGRLLSLGLAPDTQARVSDWFGAPFLARRGIAEPTFALAVLLRRLDDRVIDMGVWGIARAAFRSAGRLRLLDEHIVDGAVRGVAWATMRGAAGSRTADDRGIDGAVEWIARASWWSGRQVRRFQTGLAHQYYVVVVVGLVLLLAVTAVAT